MPSIENLTNTIQKSAGEAYGLSYYVADWADDIDKRIKDPKYYDIEEFDRNLSIAKELVKSAQLFEKAMTELRSRLIDS